MPQLDSRLVDGFTILKRRVILWLEFCQLPAQLEVLSRCLQLDLGERFEDLVYLKVPYPLLGLILDEMGQFDYESNGKEVGDEGHTTRDDTRDSSHP